MDVYRIAKSKLRARGRSSPLTCQPKSPGRPERNNPTTSAPTQEPGGPARPPAPRRRHPRGLGTSPRPRWAHPMPPLAGPPAARVPASCCRLRRCGCTAPARKGIDRISSVMGRLVHASYVKYAGVYGYTATTTKLM